MSKPIWSLCLMPCFLSFLAGFLSGVNDKTPNLHACSHTRVSYNRLNLLSVWNWILAAAGVRILSMLISQLGLGSATTLVCVIPTITKRSAATTYMTSCRVLQFNKINKIVPAQLAPECRIELQQLPGDRSHHQIAPSCPYAPSVARACCCRWLLLVALPAVASRFARRYRRCLLPLFCCSAYVSECFFLPPTLKIGCPVTCVKNLLLYQCIMPFDLPPLDHIVGTGTLVPRVLKTVQSDQPVEKVEVLQSRRNPLFIPWKGGMASSFYFEFGHHLLKLILGVLDTGHDAWIHREDWIKNCFGFFFFLHLVCAHSCHFFFI